MSRHMICFPAKTLSVQKLLQRRVERNHITYAVWTPETLKRRTKNARIRKNRRIFERSIDERAEVAALWEEICHWEIDTVVGKKSDGESVALTIVEKVTDFYIAM